MKRLKDHGYLPLSFRLIRHFHRETGEVLPKDEAQALPRHQVFDMFLDIIPDTDELETFRTALGFRPPAEPLLRHVFENGAAAPLTAFVSWDVPETVLIATQISWRR